MVFYILGVDLGQSQDFTAITVLERTPVDTGRMTELIRHRSTVRSGSTYGPGESSRRYRNTPGQTKVEVAVTENHYAARHLERLPIGTPYPVQVERIKELSDRLYSETERIPTLVVDQTGVGRPVVDMLRAARLSPAAITITGGDTVSRDGQDYRVPKRDLVSIVRVLLDSDRLTIAERLKQRATLTAELEAFKVSISLKGHDSYGNDVGPWRENPHDDLVLAVALACWLGEKQETMVYGVPQATVKRAVR